MAKNFIRCGFKKDNPIILDNECFYKKGQIQENNSTCRECNYYQKIKVNIEIKKKDKSPQRIPPKKIYLQKTPLRNDELITEIKQDIPVIKNLHPSFWVSGFTDWQLLRLNKQYQEDMEKFWNAVWKCLAYFAQKFSDWKERFEIVSDSQLFHLDFYPRKSDTYETWDEPLFSHKMKIGYLDKYPNLVPYKNTADFRRTYGEPTFWKGRILNANFRPHKTADIEVEFGSAGKKMKIKIDRLGNLYPPPIPHQVRFPFPFENRFAYLLLTKFPEKLKRYQSLQSKLHPKTGRPRKEDWPRNLLVYELSQAGMKNMEIARLLFGVKKSTDSGQEKHPVLVKIAKIKERIEGYVSQTYPFK